MQKVYQQKVVLAERVEKAKVNKVMQSGITISINNHFYVNIKVLKFVTKTEFRGTDRDLLHFHFLKIPIIKSIV